MCMNVLCLRDWRLCFVLRFLLELFLTYIETVLVQIDKKHTEKSPKHETNIKGKMVALPWNGQRQKSLSSISRFN